MCESPLQAWLDLEGIAKNGKHPLVFSLPKSSYDLIVSSGHNPRYKEIQLPCGHCFSCLRDRAWNLTVRAVFESRLYDDSTFITLTCADSYLPQVFPHGVEHRPWQLFAKRLRKAIGPFRFIMCAEYGSQTCRPHYHAIIFGHCLDDIQLLPDGTFCASKVLAECWPYGLVQASTINENRIAYVAGYTLKDYQLGRDDSWYRSRGLNKPYVKWSRRPGLGYLYFDRFKDSLLSHNVKWSQHNKLDVYSFSSVFGRNLKHFNCRYFNEKFALLRPETFDKIRASRERYAALAKSPASELKRIDDIMRSSECRQYALSLKARDVVSHNICTVNKES